MHEQLLSLTFMFLGQKRSFGILGTSAATFAALGWQFYRIYPSLSIAPVQVESMQPSNPDRDLSLLVCNVLMSNRSCEGLFAEMMSRM